MLSLSKVFGSLLLLQLVLTFGLAFLALLMLRLVLGPALVTVPGLRLRGRVK